MLITISIINMILVLQYQVRILWSCYHKFPWFNAKVNYLHDSWSFWQAPPVRVVILSMITMFIYALISFGTLLHTFADSTSFITTSICVLREAQFIEFNIMYISSLVPDTELNYVHIFANLQANSYTPATRNWSRGTRWFFSSVPVPVKLNRGKLYGV